MTTTLHRQTKARDAHRGLRLPMKSYFQMTDARKIELIGRDINISTTMIKGFITVYVGDNPLDIIVTVIDSAGVHTGTYNAPITATYTSTGAMLDSEVIAGATAYLNGIGIPTPDSWEWIMATPTSVSAQITAALASYTPSLTRTVNYPTLAVNTARQVSGNALVHAAVDITCTLSLSGGTSGKVQLQYADNAAFTTNVVNLQEYTNANTGTLTVGLNTSQTGTANLAGFIPAGKYYRLATTNITGTPTYGTPVVQEVVGI